MRLGYMLTAVGFFLSSFCLNVGGFRILPPFFGLLFMVFGMAKIRDYYSDETSKWASLTCKINLALSLFGSVLNLSNFTDKSPLSGLLPILNWVFAASYLFCGVFVFLLFRQTGRYFVKYENRSGFWRVTGYTAPTLYCISEILRIVSCFAELPYRNITAVFCTVADLLILILLFAIALSDHSAVSKQDDDNSSKKGSVL